MVDVVDVKVYYSQREWVQFTPFANGKCQSLLQSTRMGSQSLLMVDVKVYYSQQEWVHLFANGGYQSLLQLTRMGSPLY